MGQLTASYDAGTAGAPLVGDTIGVALAKMVVAQPDVEALVSRHQGVRLSYSELGARGRAGRAGLARRRDRDRRPGRHLGADMRRVDACCSSRARGSARSSSTSTRPTGRASSPTRSATPACGCSSPRVRSRRPTTSRCSPVCAASSPISRWSSRSTASQQAGRRTSTGPRWSSSAVGIDPPIRSRYRELQLDTDDPINIQYTSGTTGNPKGATLTHHNILNNAQAMARNMGYTSIDRVCIPVPLYHCFGMGIGNLGCIASGSTMVYPAAGFDPLATLEAIAEERCTSRVRRPDDVHRACSSTRGSREFDTSVAADRDHGGRAVPGRGHEARRRRDARTRDLHRVRHDRDRARVVHHPAATTTSSAASAPSAPCCRTSKARSSTPALDTRCPSAQPVRCARVATW